MVKFDVDILFYFGDILKMLSFTRLYLQKSVMYLIDYLFVFVNVRIKYRKFCYNE